MNQKVENNQNLETLRHSTSHVLAAAILELYPNTKLGIGPATEEGFYYDFDFGKEKISEKDFPKIEKKMKEIIAQDLKFEKQEFSEAEAIEKLKLSGQNYKIEIVEELLEKEKPSFYKTGKFEDLCKGPHVESTKKINPKAFKLLSLAGAYWRGSEENNQLTRIYGTIFKSEKDLKKYLKMLEEAEKRDHRKIGKELDLFSFHKQGPGFAFWHYKGWHIIQKLLEYWREVHKREDYQEINTPILLSSEVWEKSGHMENYKEKMYVAQSPDCKDTKYSVKPMNCIGGILVYNNSIHSYKDLPLKFGEIGLVHRYESSGEVHGLMRVRQFTQDDAHIYCAPDQVKEEMKKVIDLCFEVYEKFGLEIDHIELSTRPEKSIGSDEVWEKSESIMREILKEKNVKHKINEGDGAFYGPKFDFHLKDAIGRTWQCGTIQLDFSLPEKFDMNFINQKGKKEQVVMIHRVIYGSVERFLGILIENTAGAFPLWLAPEQVRIIPVGKTHHSKAEKYVEILKAKNIQAFCDKENETVGNRIRKAEKEKIPYIIVYGDKEISGDSLAVRKRGEQKIENIRPEVFENELLFKINERK